MYKRQAINEKLYYQMVEVAAKRQMGVKEWLEGVIREKLFSESDTTINDLTPDEVASLVDALMFYANPETYLAIVIVPDPPCGAFVDDVSEVDGWGCRPGKLAREVLDRIANRIPEDTAE